MVDATYAWLERHANRVLVAGALVVANLLVVELLRGSVVRDLQVFSALAIVLAAVMFLLMHRLVKRLVRYALGRARMESRLSRQMLSAVERFAGEAAGLRGTIEALSSAAADAGCEVYVWEPAAHVLWSPYRSTRTALTATQARCMFDAMALRRPVSIFEVDSGAVVPVDVARAGGAGAIVVAPMWAGADLVGMVVRRYATTRDLAGADDGSLVSGLAAIGAVALGKAIVVDREQQRLRDNELLLRSVQLSGETASADHLSIYAMQAAEAIGSQRSAIFAGSGGQLLLVAAHGIAPETLMVARRISRHSRLFAQLRAGGTAQVVTPSAIDVDVDAALSGLGFGSRVVLHAIRDAGGMVGLLVLDISDDGRFGPREASLIAALGGQVSLTIERTRMLRSMNRRSRHLACTPKLARAITGQRVPGAIARTAARELHEGFGFGRVSIALRDDDGALAVAASSGMLARSSTRVTASDVMRLAFDSGKPYVSCAGESRGQRPAAPHVTDDNAPAGCRSQMVVPIGGEGECLGVIAVYERDPDALCEDDLNILQTIADQLAGALEQATLFETLERSYFKTVEALSAALEAKDAYTLDHARSITELSAAVGRCLGMGDDEIRDLKLGALLHDIGKIGVPSEILNKPGPLDLHEQEIMKEHTVIGEQIIAPIEFLDGVRPLVLHEHERWDGAGYPHGLRGEQIPLGARIIFVCDAWHAMTSDRPYRKALPTDEALRRMRTGAGTQFDPAVVDAFFGIVESDRDLAMQASMRDRDASPVA